MCTENCTRVLWQIGLQFWWLSHPIRPYADRLYTYAVDSSSGLYAYTASTLWIWDIFSAFGVVLIRAHFRCIWWEWCKLPLDNPSALHTSQSSEGIKAHTLLNKRCFMAAIAIKLAHSQCCTIAAAASHIGWRLTTGFSRFIELVISPWKGEGVPNSHSCFNRLTVLRLLGASWDK